GQTYVSNSFRNVLSLGSDLVNVNIKAQKRANDPVCFENCYTDGAAGTVQFTDNSWTYTEGQIKKVAADNLSAVKLGDAFYTTSTMPELKAFHDVEFKLVDNGDGTHAYKCSCDFALASEEHKMVDGEVKIEGNCTTDRVVAQVCSICGSEGTDKVTTAPGHTEGEVKIENKVVEDCEKDGSYDEVVYCTVCEKELSRVKKTVGKLGHTEGEVKIENKVAADCENDGSYEEVVYCTVCEKELSRVKKTVGKLGHSEGEVKIENKVVEDCEKDGSYEEVVYCTVCEKELSRVKKTVGKLGHTEGEVKIENKVAADCENDGSYEEVVYCTVCEKELSRVKKTVGKLGHTEGEVKIENKVAADCENDGSYEEVVNCTVCKKELSRVKKTVGKLGHTEGEVKIENKVAADCENDGSYEEVVNCTVCKQELSRVKKTVGKLGHTEGEVKIENKVAADCVTDGSHDEVVYCTVCQKEVSREKKIDGKLGHTFKGVEAIEANCTTGGNIAHKVCEVCGKYFAADDTDVYSVEYLDYDKDIATDVDATDHDLVKYGKVEPTYENEGVEEHYACSRCEKIYADVEGKEEVETKDLIIDKLVKEEDNISTEDKTEDESDDKTDDKPAGDNSNESPVTGESVVSVAAVAALIGAAFVFVRKSKKV
ncbi:MAG: hypothetical protein IKL46_06030, partial [Clostridia bacterium]|nr:hypothetical protein [Clostridia bacterium]